MGRIIDKVQQVSFHEPTWIERLADASVRPYSGSLIAALTLSLAFWVIRLIGEGLIEYVTEPFFDNVYSPVMMRMSHMLGYQGLWHDVLVGKLIEGEISFDQSFGVLTTGVFIPLGAVLPYVFAFYLVLSLLEDLGYLPRLPALF